MATAGPEEPLLAKETALLSAVMYKNNSQHRRTLSFQHLRQVDHIRTNTPLNTLSFPDSRCTIIEI